MGLLGGFTSLVKGAIARPVGVAVVVILQPGLIRGSLNLALRAARPGGLGLSIATSQSRRQLLLSVDLWAGLGGVSVQSNMSLHGK